MFQRLNTLILAVFAATVATYAAPNAGYIKSLRFVTGANKINYAIISTSSPQIVGGSQNYVGAETSGVPYTVIQLPSDPVLAALTGSSLERARQVTSVKFYYIDVAIGSNSSLCNVPGISGGQWVNVITNWHLGE